MFTRLVAPFVNPVLNVLQVAPPQQRHRAQWQPNPAGSTMLLALGIGAAAVVGGYYLHKELSGTDPNKIKPPAPALPDVALASHILPGGTLGLAPDVVADVMQPIFLATYNTPSDYPKVGEVVILTNTTLQKLDEVAFGINPDGAAQDNAWTGSLGGNRMTGLQSPKSIALLVTNTSGEFANAAYQWALAAIAQDETSWSDEMRDATIAKILTTIAPEIDWSQGLQPYTAVDAAYKAWTAVLLLGQVAYQNLVNKSQA